MSSQVGKVTRDQATVHRRSNFFEAAVATQVGLQDAITKLKIKATDQSLTFAERGQIEAEIGQLEGRLANVQAQAMAFLANQASVQPPTAQDLKVFKELSFELHSMIANAVVASAIIGSVTKLLSAWDAIQ